MIWHFYFFKELLVFTLVNGAPNKPLVDADFFADNLLKHGFNAQDSNIKAPTDKTSPSAAAALAYIKALTNDELCGNPSKI